MLEDPRWMLKNVKLYGEKKEKEELFVEELLSLERSNDETKTWWEKQTWSKLQEIVLAILIHTNCT